MAETIVTSQIRYTGGGPLDKKLEPVATYQDLLRIPRSQRYEGMVVVVLSDTSDSGDGERCEFWLVGGTMNNAWQRKTADVRVSGDDLV